AFCQCAERHPRLCPCFGAAQKKLRSNRVGRAPPTGRSLVLSRQAARSPRSYSRGSAQSRIPLAGICERPAPVGDSGKKRPPHPSQGSRAKTLIPSINHKLGKEAQMLEALQTNLSPTATQAAAFRLALLEVIRRQLEPTQPEPGTIATL